MDELERRAHAAGAADAAAVGEAGGSAAAANLPPAPAAADGGDDDWRRLQQPVAVEAPVTPVADDAEDMEDDGDEQMAAVRATLADGGGPSGLRATLAAGGGPRGLQRDDLVMRIGPAAVVELYSPPRVTASLPRPSVVRALGPAPVAAGAKRLPRPRARAKLRRATVSPRSASSQMARKSSSPRCRAAPGEAESSKRSLIRGRSTL